LQVGKGGLPPSQLALAFKFEKFGELRRGQATLPNLQFSDYGLVILTLISFLQIGL
jgi:hypothetical protein